MYPRPWAAPCAATGRRTQRVLYRHDADHYASCGTHLCSLPCEGSSVIDSAWTGGIDGDSLVGDTHYNAHPRFGALGRGVYMGDILAPGPQPGRRRPPGKWMAWSLRPQLWHLDVPYTMGSALRRHGANTTRPLSWNPPYPPLRDPVLNPGQGGGATSSLPGPSKYAEQSTANGLACFCESEGTQNTRRSP